MGFLDDIRELFTGRSPAPTAAELREIAAPADPDELHSAAQMGSRYVRRLTDSNQRPLDPIVREQMLKIAYYLYDSNPIAKRILELTRDFVLGDEVTLSLEPLNKEPHPGQEVLDAFWNDPLNRMDLKLWDRVLELGMYGEQIWPVSVNTANGHTRLGYIDPASVQKVEYDLEAIDEPRRVIVRGPSGTEPITYEVVRLDEDPGSKTYGRMIVPGEKSCFFFAVNKVSNSDHGRSDLLAVADWVDLFDQTLFNEADRQVLLKSFVWDVTLQDADQAKMDAYAASNPPPKPGSVRYHNQTVKWEAVTPDLKSADAQTGADLLLSVISSGVGIPKFWLNGIMDVNRASATEMGEPTIKHLEARQRYVGYMLRLVGTFVLDQAEIRGRLPRRKADASGTPAPWPLSVNLPPLRAKDQKAIAETFSTAMNGLAVARQEGAVDLEVMIKVAVMLLGQLGIEVDVDALRLRLEAEKAEREARAAAMAAQFAGTRDDEDDEEQDDQEDEEEEEGDAVPRPSQPESKSNRVGAGGRNGRPANLPRG